MSKEEKTIVKESEDEMRRKGKFKRIFPSFEFAYYKQFFEEDRPLNYLLDAKIMNKMRMQVAT